jgi:hypothetical protein
MNNREYQEILENLLHRIDLLEKQLKKSKKADKDYDGDGEVESGTEEYFGSKDKAIKKAIAKKKNKKIEEALDRVGGNYNNNNPGLRCLMHMVNKNSPLVESASNILSNKKQTTTNKFKDNGTKIQLSESLTFGGFPALRKLNENGVVSQFNDADDKGNDERVATQPDNLSDLQAQLNNMEDQFHQAESDLSDSDSRWSGTMAGRSMRKQIADLENKIRVHPETQAKIKAAEAARAAQGPGFFSRRAKDPDWLHDASQRGEMIGGLPAPSETPRERGLGLGPKSLPPTDYDLGKSGRRER